MPFNPKKEISMASHISEGVLARFCGMGRELRRTSIVFDLHCKLTESPLSRPKIYPKQRYMLFYWMKIYVNLCLCIKLHIDMNQIIPYFDARARGRMARIDTGVGLGGYEDVSMNDYELIWLLICHACQYMQLYSLSRCVQIQNKAQRWQRLTT